MFANKAHEPIGPKGGPGVLGPWRELPRPDRSAPRTAARTRVALGLAAAAAATVSLGIVAML